MKEELKEKLKELSKRYGIPGVDLDRVIVPLKLLDILPYEVAKIHRILLIMEKGDTLVLAMANPTDKKVISELEFVTGKKIFPTVVLDEQLTDIIEQCYSLKKQGKEVFVGKEASDFLKKGESIDEKLFRDKAQILPEKESIPIIDKKEEEKELEEKLKAIDEIIDSCIEDDISQKKPPVEKKVLKVLVVEDEEDIRRLISKLLKEKGYEVVEASRGLEALSLIQKEKIDLIILDAMLPEIHGFEICKKVKSSDKYHHIPIIMISAVYRGWRYAQDLKESYGVDLFIEKPFKLSDLLKGIKAVTEHNKNNNENRTYDNENIIQNYLKEAIKQYKKGDTKGAIQVLSSAIEKNPSSYKLHYHLALLYWKEERLFQAIRELEKALEINPDFFEAIQILSQLYQKTGFKHKAVEMLEKAISLCKDNEQKKKLKEQLIRLL